MLLLGSFSEGLTAFGQFTDCRNMSPPTLTRICWRFAFNTLIFVVGSSLLATLLALFLAYLNTRTNMPFKGVFTVLSIVPMMIPHLLFSVSWALLLNPSNGLINLVLQEHVRAGIGAVQHLLAVGHDSGRGAAEHAHCLSDHRTGHGLL